MWTVLSSKATIIMNEKIMNEKILIKKIDLTYGFGIFRLCTGVMDEADLTDHK